MTMKKYIVLMLSVVLVIATMGGKVEGVSCEVKCMLKCGGLLVPENTCIEPCIHAQCHKPPSLPSPLSQRNVREVEGIACWNKCTFLCDRTMTPIRTCSKRCLKKCHISYVFPAQLS
ncbi:unnamed protein product [Arabidopsis halleri]